MQKISFLVLVCLLASATLAAAQVPTGTISGRVASSDDAPLPGVTVTVTSPNLQGERTVITSVNGDYVVPLLPPGDYTLVFELSGFQSVKREVGLAEAPQGRNADAAERQAKCPRASAARPTRGASASRRTSFARCRARESSSSNSHP